MVNFKSLKKIYNREYLILLGIGFLPLMWKILEISFLSQFENALKIIGQLALISIIFKVFEETIFNPLYKMFSSNQFNSEEDKFFIIYKFLFYYTVLIILFTSIVFLSCEFILKFSQVPGYIFNETLLFVKIYTIACGVGVIAKFLYTSSLINKDTNKMFVYFLLKSLATTILFICFVPEFALGWGVNGVAIAELIINIVTIIYFILTMPNIKSRGVEFGFKQYLKLLVFSFVETLIRNVVYYFVILVFLNMIDNQDLYFVSNDFIWSIMLVPTLAQSSLIKQEFANYGYTSLKPYFINSILLMLYIILLIPIALIVFKYIYRLQNYAEYFVVLLKLLPCYILFVIDSVIESYFIVTGKIHHVLVQSIITNILVYLTALILYMFGVWVITLNSIILLFNLGVVISSIYTILIYILENRKNIYYTIG